MTWSDHKKNAFDIRLFVCGYESRSPFVSQQHADNSGSTIVLDYECKNVIQYNINHDYFSSIIDAKFIGVNELMVATLKVKLAEIISKLKDKEVTVLFDVSSCSRSVMARVLLVLNDVLVQPSKVTCVYALSAFSMPPNGELPSHISEPVVGDLSGWSDDLAKAPCAVIGLGFEPGRAIGCMDYLEIPEVRLFMPVGVDGRFADAVRAANAVLIDEAGSSNVLPYDVLDPSSTYQKLESLVHGLLAQYRPVLIPLGPKMLAALSIILAIKLHPRVCVWRTSAGSGEEVEDKVASGEISVFTTTLGRSAATGAVV